MDKRVGWSSLGITIFVVIGQFKKILVSPLWPPVILASEKVENLK